MDIEEFAVCCSRSVFPWCLSVHCEHRIVAGVAEMGRLGGGSPA